MSVSMRALLAGPVAFRPSGSKMKAFPAQCQEFWRALELARVHVGAGETALGPILEEKCKELLNEERPREVRDGGARDGDETRQDAKIETPALPEFASAGWDPLALLGNALTRERESVPSRPSLELIAPELLRAIAWGGDRRRGTARLELGGSRYAGATLQIEAAAHVVSVELEAPAGVDASELAERIEKRLRGRGLEVASLVVR